MAFILDIIVVVCVGLLTGTELAVAVFIHPTLRKLETREELRAVRFFAAKLGQAMPFWYGIGLLLLIAEMIVRHNQTGEVLLIVASTIWAVVIVLTILFLVPINNRLARMNPDIAGETALKDHARWDRMHRWRVTALTASMICLLSAILPNSR